MTSKVEQGLFQFSFSWIGRLTKTKVQSEPYYLPIAGQKTDKLMLFSKVLVWSENKTTARRIWTRVADSIFHNNDR